MNQLFFYKQFQYFIFLFCVFSIIPNLLRCHSNRLSYYRWNWTTMNHLNLNLMTDDRRVVQLHLAFQQLHPQLKNTYPQKTNENLTSIHVVQVKTQTTLRSFQCDHSKQYPTFLCGFFGRSQLTSHIL